MYLAFSISGTCSCDSYRNGFLPLSNLACLRLNNLITLSYKNSLSQNVVVQFRRDVCNVFFFFKNFISTQLIKLNQTFLWLRIFMCTILGLVMALFKANNAINSSRFFLSNVCEGKRNPEYFLHIKHFCLIPKSLLAHQKHEQVTLPHI